MDTSEMKELLTGYLGELDWSNGATKDDMMAHLAGRDEDLRTMINEYVAEGTYKDLDAVLYVLPVQGWQDTQGDKWRGPTSLDPEDVPSNFQDGPAGEDERDAPRTGGATVGAAGRVGESGGNAGEVDPGVSGSAETVGGVPQGSGAGFGNAVGGGGTGDVATTVDDTNH